MPRVVVPVFSISPPKAALTTALAGSNNDLVFTAKAGGPGGNQIAVTYVVAGLNTALSVTMSGYDIIVNVATDGAGVGTSTATQIANAVNGAAYNLVTVANAAANDGTGIVIALTRTLLTGGSLQNTPPTQVNGDTTNDHYFTGNDGSISLEVVSSDAGTQTVAIRYSPFYAAIATVADQVESIPAGATRVLGPFANGAFDQNAAHDVYFHPSVSTTLKFRAYQTVKQS